MVLLHLKQNADRQFLYEAASTSCVDDVVRELVAVHNLQLRIFNLKQTGNDLALYGPSKPPRDDDEDDSDDDEQAQNKKPRGPFYNRDPSSRRTGEACDPEVAKVLTKAVEDANTCASKDQVMYKLPLTVAMLKEAIHTIRGAVMICYSMGLPSHDPVQQEIIGTSTAKETLDPDTAHMWWAGKEMMRDKCLREIVGNNEKTKVIVKLQSKGQGCPQREPPIDEETHKAMMSWYFKQQEQQKALAQDEDDAYTNAKWANPKALKSYLNGMDNLKTR